jgi:HEAT repeat protein
MRNLQAAIVVGIVLSLVAPTMAATASSRARSENNIERLIELLNDESTAWSADVGLQKLGLQAVPALLANLRAHPQRSCSGRISDTMRVLVKIGAPAIPYLARHYFDDRWSVVEALGRIGPAAIPELVEIAEKETGSNQESALAAALGAEYYGPNLEHPDDPWYAVGPPQTERELRGAQLIPLLPRVWKMMDEGVREWRPGGPIPQLPCAYALARWGTAQMKAAGVKVLLDLGSTNELFVHYRHRALSLLAALHIGLASEPIIRHARAIPETEGADQYQLAAARMLYVVGDPSFLQFAIPLLKGSGFSIRHDAIWFAAQTLDLRFVPELIERLTDTTTQSGGQLGGEYAHQEEVREVALQVLERITLQALGPRPEDWRRWWRQNETITRAQLVRAQVAGWLRDFDSTPVWELNARMRRLVGTYDPVILPLVRSYINHPQLFWRQTGPGGTGWGGLGPDHWPWDYSPYAVDLLLGLTEKGNHEARRMLYECLHSVDGEVREFGALAMSTFDRKTATDFLVLEMNQKDPFTARKVGTMLLRLGDPRGAAGLIRFLQDSSESKGDSGLETTYDLLREFTQEDILYDPAGSFAEREAGVERWWSWWRSNEKTFQVRVDAATLDRQSLALFRERASRTASASPRR